MEIAESGALICSCGNQELVLVACLPPWQDIMSILCRNCMEKGTLYLSSGEKMEYRVVTVRKRKLQK